MQDSSNLVDQNRRFIISFWLSDDTISIYEPPQRYYSTQRITIKIIANYYRNSGIKGGLFLERTRISKPGSAIDNPEFYKPQDFAMGTTVECFKHKFTITDADRYVLTYMMERKDEFSAELIEALAKKHELD